MEEKYMQPGYNSESKGVTRIGPCKFCNSRKTELSTVKLSDLSQIYFVVCYTCVTKGPNSVSEDKAVSYWNGFLLTEME